MWWSSSSALVHAECLSCAICVQDASEHLKHAESKEEGYGIIQTMLATLGAQSSQYSTDTRSPL